MSSEERLPSRRMADDLREAITSGRYGPGDFLPSARQLATEYVTARNTASEAFSILQGEGLIDVEHGKRPRVRIKRPMIRLGANRYSNKVREETGLSPFRAEALKQGRTSVRVDAEISRSLPPDDVANRLAIEPSEYVVKRVNVYFVDNEPLQIGTTYSPWKIVEGSPLATEPHVGQGSIYGRFEELGHRITKVREEVGARMPKPDEVGILQIPAGVPVIDVLHTGIDQNSVPFEVTHFVMRADLNGLDYQMAVED
jgi:GntR family transcriptional regulator